MKAIRYETEVEQLKRLKAEAQSGKRWTGLTPGRENIPFTVKAFERAIEQAEFSIA